MELSIDSDTFQALRKHAELFAVDLDKARQELVLCAGQNEVHQRSLEQAQARIRYLESENQALQSQFQRAAECDARMQIQVAHLEEMRARYKDLIDNLSQLASHKKSEPVPPPPPPHSPVVHQNHTKEPPTILSVPMPPDAAAAPDTVHTSPVPGMKGGGRMWSMGDSIRY